VNENSPRRAGYIVSRPRHIPRILLYLKTFLSLSNVDKCRKVKKPKRLAFAAHVTFVTSGSHLLLRFSQVIDFFHR
jgi:hypothetical protein